MASSWNNYQSAPRNSPNAHIIQTPLPFSVILGVAWLVSVAIVGLAADILRLGGVFYATVWGLIIACVTLIAVLYILITSSIQAAASLYHRRTVLALLLVATVFWAVGIINLARDVSGVSTCYSNRDSYKQCEELLDPKAQPYYNEMLAMVVLEGVNCSLFFIDLVIFGLLERRARLEGRPMTYWAAQRAAGYHDAGQQLKMFAQGPRNTWQVGDLEGHQQWKIPGQNGQQQWEIPGQSGGVIR